MTSDSRNASPLASLFLERALLFTMIAHLSAMLSMALLLLPGMPGASSIDARAAYVAANPWLWRLGWLPWHITALSNVVLGIALIRTQWIPRVPAIFALITTLIAVLIEQPGEISWISEGVSLAQRAIETGNLAAYLEYESRVYPQVAGAAAFYVLSALGWTWCFAKAKTWSPQLSWLSVIVWSALFYLSVGIFFPAAYRPSYEIIAVGNAMGFVLMMLWFALVTEHVLRRSRLESLTGRMAKWVYPYENILGPFINWLAQSRLLRYLGEHVPTLAFRSDISNVIYVNYLVEAERVKHLLPDGLELQLLGADKAYTLFTHLSYKHGHFGPRLLGSLRRFMPSPVQSNWRLYVYDPHTKHQGIYFVTIAINQILPSLLARFLSEGIPMHLLKQGEVIEQENSFRVLLNSGTGSAPDLDMSLKASSEPVLQAPWNLCFKDFHELLAYCVPQDRGMSGQAWYGRVTRGEIQLPIALESCEPLSGTIVSQAAQRYVGDSEAICFRVPEVKFLFTHEEYDYKTK